MMENKKEPGKCIPVQASLSKCIKTKVPSFQKVQTDCLNHMKAYENCLRANQDNNPTAKCFDDLQSLRKCAGLAVQ